MDLEYEEKLFAAALSNWISSDGDEDDSGGDFAQVPVHSRPSGNGGVAEALPADNKLWTKSQAELSSRVITDDR